MIIVSFVFLFLLASVESGLAYMRELLSADDAALVAGLLGGTAAEATEQTGRWITTAAQMGMGFILPFALAFIAIPLESFIHSSRTVLGVLLAAFLRFCAVFSRFMGNLSRYIGKSLVKLYDLAIFFPLWIESIVLRFEAKHEKTDKQDKNSETKEETKKSTTKRARKSTPKKEDNTETQKDES
jgi:hypothetical protein